MFRRNIENTITQHNTIYIAQKNYFSSTQLGIICAIYPPKLFWLQKKRELCDGMMTAAIIISTLPSPHKMELFITPVKCNG
jgi:hypothetical protein